MSNADLLNYLMNAISNYEIKEEILHIDLVEILLTQGFHKDFIFRHENGNKYNFNVKNFKDLSKNYDAEYAQSIISYTKGSIKLMIESTIAILVK